VLGFLQQPQEAEDIAQDVFVRIYQSIKDFRHESGLGTWIYRIAVTKSLDQLRKNKRRRMYGSIFPFFGKEEEQPDFLHPGIKAEQKENSIVLFRAMNKLPENQKAAFILQKLEGLSQEEIASVMKTTVSSVESLIQRAKQNLRKYLKEYYTQNER
jgi:RNA polymerase sigma factor (sigma-70 family)